MIALIVLLAVLVAANALFVWRCSVVIDRTTKNIMCATADSIKEIQTLHECTAQGIRDAHVVTAQRLVDATGSHQRATADLAHASAQLVEAANKFNAVLEKFENLRRYFISAQR